jgi:hypothetical protein
MRRSSPARYSSVSIRPLATGCAAACKFTDTHLKRSALFKSYSEPLPVCMISKLWTSTHTGNLAVIVSGLFWWHG